MKYKTKSCRFGKWGIGFCLAAAELSRVLVVGAFSSADSCGVNSVTVCVLHVVVGVCVNVNKRVFSVQSSLLQSFVAFCTEATT